MTTPRIASIAAATLIALSASLTGVAHADTGLTRAQVKAELAEAQRTGNLPDYETGRMLNELFPSAYPAKVQPARIRPAVSKAGINASGLTDYDAIAQRNAEAIARRDGVEHDGQMNASKR